MNEYPKNADDMVEVLRVCRLALDQLASLTEAAAMGQHVILNGVRMTASRAADRVAFWAKDGIEACELMIVRDLNENHSRRG